MKYTTVSFTNRAISPLVRPHGKKPHYGYKSFTKMPTLLYQTFKQAPPLNKRPIYLDEIGRLFEASKAKTKNHYTGIYFTVKYRDTLPHCKQNR